MGRFDFDKLVKNYSNASHMSFDYKFEDLVDDINASFNKSVDFEFVVNQFFEMFQIYLDNMPEEKRNDFIQKVFNSFFLRFNCDFDEDIIMLNIPYKDELQDFFIQKYEYVNEFINGFVHFNDEDYMNKMFVDFKPSVDDVEVNSFVSRNIDTLMPNYAIRYNINDIISQFSHDVINKKDVNLENKYKYSKKLIMCFIYLSILTQFNKDYNVLGMSFNNLFANYFKTIKKTVVKSNGDVNVTVPTGSAVTKVVNDITDCFSHVSGNFKYLYTDNKMEFKNRFDTTIEVNVDEFLDGMDKLLNVDLPKMLPQSYNGDLSNAINNGSINILIDLVNKVKSNRFDDIENREIMFLMGYLQLCFNQEGLLDTEIMSQYSLIDCTDFTLDYGFDMDQVEAGNIELFKTHHLVYTDTASSDKMNNFWSNYINDFNVADGKKAATLCDISKMVFDKKNKIYIPSSEVIMHLRNSLRHGRYKIEEDKIHFWDQKNKNDAVRPSQVYFNLSIDCDKFLKFLSGNIINEVLYIEFSDLYKNDGTVNDFKSSRDHNKLFFYESEMAYSKNSFKNYMDVLKTRFYYLDLEEFIDILINQNLISRYLADNMDKFDEFLDYELDNGIKLVDYIKQKYDFDINLTEDELDVNIKLINGLLFEMRKLIEFELASKSSTESVFFKYYFEYFYKKSNIFKNDFRLPREIEEKIIKAKMDSEYLLSSIDYSKKYTRNFLLSLALFKHKDFNEFDRLSVLASNSLYLKNIYGEERPIDFTYENVIKKSDENDMFMESTAKAVKKVRVKSLFRKGITAFKGLCATGVVASPFVLYSLNNTNYLEPGACAVLMAFASASVLYNSPEFVSKFSHDGTIENQMASEKYIEENLENDDLFQRQVRRSKR